MLKMSSNSLQTFVKLNSAYEKQLVKNNFFLNFALFFCKYLTKILTFPNSNKFKNKIFTITTTILSQKNFFRKL